MKMIKPLGIKAYEFKNLGKKAKEKAISEYINFIVEFMSGDDNLYNNFKDEVEESERMNTPWFLGSIIYENRKSCVIEMIECNEYLFDKYGDMLPITKVVNFNKDRGCHEVIKYEFSLTGNESIEIELVEMA